MFTRNVKLLLPFFLLGIFLLPLVYWPRAAIPFEIPKVWFAQRWIEILGLIAVWAAFREKNRLREGRIDQGILLGVVVFVAIAVVSSLLGVNFQKSLYGNYYRLDGLLTLFHLVTFFLVVALFWEASWRRLTAIALALGSFLVSAWSLVLGFRFHWLGDETVYHFGKAIGGAFGQPNFLAGYLLVSLPFVGYLLQTEGATDKRARIFWLTALFCQIGAIILTFSRAAVAGILILTAMCLIWRKVKEKDKAKACLTGLTFLLIGLFFVLFFTPKTKSFTAGIEEKTRERIFVKGVSGIIKRPLLGWGWANFDYVFEASEWPIKLANDIYVDKAHSHFWEILTTLGFLGFLAYLLLILRVLNRLYRLKSDFWNFTVLASFLLFLFHSQTNIISIAEELMFWLILGIVGSSEKVASRP
ncbi:MAG TPA: O-antigen ligase family protein [Clostridia bacterium]|nr:O-antigen ligase family protein [Clostridia bacterium]